MVTCGIYRVEIFQEFIVQQPDICVYIYIYMCVYVCIYTLLSPLCKKNFHPLKKFVASIQTQQHEGAPRSSNKETRSAFNLELSISVLSPGGRGLSWGSFSMCIAKQQQQQRFTSQRRNTWCDKSGCIRVRMHAHGRRRSSTHRCRPIEHNIIERRGISKAHVRLRSPLERYTPIFQ